MFADIVPEQLRSTVYAFDRSFEGAVAACAAPLVGKPKFDAAKTVVSPEVVVQDQSEMNHV